MNRCTANLMNKMRKLKLNYNTLSVTNECSRIPGEELWTNSSWFLWIRVEVLYDALMVKHKWGTHKQHKHINDMAIWCNAQSKRERVRVNGSNANTKICFEVRAHSSTSPPSYRRISTNSSTQDFPHREPPLRILGKYNLRVHNSSLNKYNLSLEVRH